MKNYILVVDSIGKVKLELSIYLNKYNIEIIHIKDILEMDDKVFQYKEHLTLVIWYIPSNEDGQFQIIKDFKNKELLKDIPLIIISNYNQKEFIVKAISAGAIDFITIPFTEELIIKKINQFIDISSNNKKGLYEEIYGEDDKVSFSLQEILSIHLKGVTRGNHQLSIVMMRLISTNKVKEGRKKQIIDIISKVIKTKLRETDIIIQYGIGDILILLPFTDKAGAYLVEKKILDNCINSVMLNQKADGFILATSIVSIPEDGRNKEHLLSNLTLGLQPEIFFRKD